jgi:signal peptidase I
MEPEREPEKHEPIKKSVVREYFESAVITLIMALFGMTFIVQAVKVPTGSMQNTIYVGDHLLVNKFVLSAQDGPGFPVLPAREIKRGDIIVFKYPLSPETNYVKRVIGLPGDTVEYNSETSRVYINGEELPERRVQAKDRGNAPLELEDQELAPPGAHYTVYYFHLGEDGVARRVADSSSEYGVSQPFKVPVKGDPLVERIKENPQLVEMYDADHDGRYDSDQYFCMGDNRDNSQDSRYWGTVPRSNVVGRAMFVYWSIDQSDPEEESGNFIVRFFTRTLWSRTGKFIK